MKTADLQEQLASARTMVQSLQTELAETNHGLLLLTMELEQRVDERTTELRATHDELRSTNSELMQLTLELEDRVAQRTSELLQANQDLQLHITERNEAEGARRAAERKFRILVEQSLAGIYIIQGDSFVYVNPKMSEIIGFSQEELVSRPVTDFVHEDDRGMTAENIRRRLVGAVDHVRYQLRMRHKDGRVLHAEAHGTRSEYNGAPAIIGTLLDITERKLAEEKINMLNAELELRVQERTSQLEAANKELEAFSYSVSHDLRAPLRHVQGYVEMLEHTLQGQLSDKAKHYLKTIKDSGLEMGQLIDDLLDFSRMGRVALSETNIQVETVVRNTIKSLELAVQDRNIVWKIDPLPQVLADPTALKQVMANLIGNAVKYSRQRDPAEIEIGCAGEEEGRLVLFVKDNGAGFDMRYAHKLFGVFQRLHRAEEFEGTGIGLATVRRVIGRHGGRTWAEGRVNGGATIYFTLKPALVN